MISPQSLPPILLNSPNSPRTATTTHATTRAQVAWMASDTVGSILPSPALLSAFSLDS